MMVSQLISQPLGHQLALLNLVSFCYFVIITLSLSLSLSLHFNGHFPGEPGLAGVY